MHVITVEFVIEPGRTEAFREAMLRQARNSLDREPGCLQFDVCFDPNDAKRVFLYEIYVDRDAFDEHLRSAHFLEFDATVKDWLTSKSVRAWTRFEPPGEEEE